MMCAPREHIRMYSKSRCCIDAFSPQWKNPLTMTKPHSSHAKKSTHTKVAHHNKNAHVRVHVSHQIDKRQPWAAQDSAYQSVQRLVAGAGAVEIFGRDALTEALRKDVALVIGCMDERCVPPKNWKKISVAGSCVLLTDDQIDLFIDHIRHAGLLPNIQAVSYHQCCGACGIYCKGHDLESTEPSLERVGRSVAESMMMKLGLPGEPLFSGFGAKTKDAQWRMTGNPHLHHARGIVVNGIPHFNPYALALPACFEIDACFSPDATYLRAELDVALSIAMGDHGFGREMFDPASGGSPLSILIVPHPTDPALSFDTLDFTVKAAAASYGDAVQIVRMDVGSHDLSLE